MFLLDSSGSIGTQNWGTMMTMIQGITNALNLGATTVNAGYSQFGGGVRGLPTCQIVQNLTSSRTLANNAVSYLTNNYMAASTYTLESLRIIVPTLLWTNRTVAGVPATKVIMLITDGYANGPAGNPVQYGETINSWEIGQSPSPLNISNPLPTANWKLIVAGIGGASVNTSSGYAEVQAMNYLPGQAMMAAWSNLNSLVSSIVDATCS